MQVVKLRTLSPPQIRSTTTVRNTVSVVSTVRAKVWLMLAFTTSSKAALRSRLRFSRTRSKMTMVSLIEKPMRVSKPAITCRSIFTEKNEPNRKSTKTSTTTPMMTSCTMATKAPTP